MFFFWSHQHPDRFLPSILSVLYTFVAYLHQSVGHNKSFCFIWCNKFIKSLTCFSSHQKLFFWFLLVKVSLVARSWAILNSVIFFLRLCLRNEIISFSQENAFICGNISLPDRDLSQHEAGSRLGRETVSSYKLNFWRKKGLWQDLV